MKKTGTCPRCGSTDIYCNDGKLQFSDRSFITTSLFTRAPLVTYACASCGYVEDYLDITKTSHLERLKKNWKRAGM